MVSRIRVVLAALVVSAAMFTPFGASGASPTVTAMSASKPNAMSRAMEALLASAFPRANSTTRVVVWGWSIHRTWGLLSYGPPKSLETPVGGGEMLLRKVDGSWRDVEHTGGAYDVADLVAAGVDPEDARVLVEGSRSL